MHKRLIAVFSTFAVFFGLAKLPFSTQSSPRAKRRSGQTSSTDSSRAFPHFREIARQAGLTHTPHSSSERRYIVETMGGGGVALFDCDNDGKLDIAVADDSTIGRYLRSGDPMITLYHQDSVPGSIHFSDVTQAAGLTTRGWGNAIAVGDFDNDGLPDLYVTGYGHNALYHNLGGCKFEGAGLGTNGEVYGNMAADFGDFDRDGKLDLVVTRYGKQPASLYRNDAQGFTDRAVEAKIAAPTWSPVKWGVGFGDFDNDDWPDILIANGNFSSLLDAKPRSDRCSRTRHLSTTERQVLERTS